MTDINYVEVGFDKYCPLCKYEKLIETNEPCNECLSYSHNENSEKPVLFAEK